MKELQFTVPLIPPSVNSYVRHTRKGTHYVTSEAKAYKNAIALLSRGKRVEGDQYGVEIYVTLGHGQKGDIDNFAKVVLDGLRDAGVIHSDAAVTCLALFKDRGPEPGTGIKVWSR